MALGHSVHENNVLLQRNDFEEASRIALMCFLGRRWVAWKVGGLWVVESIY